MRGGRNGISTFFYFAIPAVLALAALWWLAFGKGVHYFSRELSMERRAAQWVGAAVTPKEPMKIEVGPDTGGAQIDRIAFDGGDLWIYYSAPHGAGYIKYNWKQYAPDGTVVASGWGYPSIGSENDAPDDLAAGEKAEVHVRIRSDRRAVRMKVWLS